MDPAAYQGGHDLVTRATSAIAGAADGFVETMRRYDLPETTREASHESVRLVQGAAAEMRGNGHASVLIQERAERVETRVDAVVDRAEAAAEDLQRNVYQRKDAALEAMHEMRELPEEVRHETRAATRSVVGMARWNGIAVGGAALLGMAAYFLLAAAITQSLMIWLGPVAGMWAGFGVFAVATAAVFFGARAVAKRHTEDAKRHVERLRNDVRRAFEPARDAIRGTHGPSSQTSTPIRS